jgi:hypothetical protein
MPTNSRSDAGPARLREARLLTEYGGKLLRVCKLVVTQRDTSLYLVPYSPQRKFFFGQRRFPEKVGTVTCNRADSVEVDGEPKLSIHESGQVHVKGLGVLAGPLQSVPLANLRGEHMATVTVERFEGLMEFKGAPSSGGQYRDYVVRAEGAESGRHAIYINGAAPEFADGPCWITLRLGRSTLPRPIYVGVSAVGQAPLSDRGETGVAVIAGWNPRLPSAAEQDFLYVRGT